MLLELKGDLPGHEFHGNQWTDGIGGGSTSIASEQDSRHAGLEAKARAGDKQAEAEAQRMALQAKYADTHNRIGDVVQVRAVDQFGHKFTFRASANQEKVRVGENTLVRFTEVGRDGNPKQDNDKGQIVTRQHVIESGFIRSQLPLGLSKRYAEWEELELVAPFTYRDDGTLVPLSERFNPKDNDTRKFYRYTDKEVSDSVGVVVKAPQ